MPLAAAAESLPPVQIDRLDARALRERFAHPPDWKPEFTGDRFRLDRGDPRAAAVLVPIVTHASGTTVLFTQRTMHLRHHSGQVAFPGGRIESTDRSPIDAALREAEEEIGLEPGRVDVIGCLPDYLTGTGFEVTPVVGLLQPGFQPKPDPYEVDDVFEVPLAFLMDPRHHQQRRVRIPGLEPGAEDRVFFAMPWRAHEGADERFIWGATASMLRNLYRLLIA